MDDEASLRDDATLAAEIMEDTCPSAIARLEVLSQLLESISIAERVAPRSWAVTMFGDGFRLNVGPVEVYTFFDGTLRVLLLSGSSESAVGQIVPVHYKSLPLPQSLFIGKASDMAHARPTLRFAHSEFVRRAAVNPSGKPAKSRFAATHSPGLCAYAQAFVKSASNSDFPTPITGLA